MQRTRHPRGSSGGGGDAESDVIETRAQPGVFRRLERCQEIQMLERGLAGCELRGS